MDATPVDGRVVTPPGRYLVVLMVLLCIATFCEGYDFFIVSLVLDLLSKEFNTALTNVFYALAIINVGAVAAFFVVRLGDRFGRKPLLLAGVLGYAGLSLVTALSPSMMFYLVVQTIAKMFLVVEFSIAIVMVIEEYPSNARATCVALLEVAGAIGGGTALIASRYILPAWGWRGMYWLGGIPVTLVPIMYFIVRETGHFRLMRTGRLEEKKSLWDIWRSRSRKFVVPVGLIWFLGYLSYAGMIYFWVVFVKVERGWSAEQVGPVMSIAALVGMSGYIVSGKLMDMIGRKPIGIVFFIASAASITWAFTASDKMLIPAVVTCMFFVFALLPINSTFNAELFPTDVRSNAMSWCNSLIGRPAQVVAPLIVASLTDRVGGIGTAVCYLGIGPLLGALIIWFILPETKGRALD